MKLIVDVVRLSFLPRRFLHAGAQCGLGCHKKCLESLTIQCGHKRLPRKMTTFGVDLSQHLAETGTAIPHLLAKCINEIDNRGIQIKVRAIYFRSTRSSVPLFSIPLDIFLFHWRSFLRQLLYRSLTYFIFN